MSVPSIKQMLEDSAARHPGQVAMRFKSDGVWRTRTYSGLLERVQQVVGVLAAAEIGSDDRSNT